MSDPHTRATISVWSLWIRYHKTLSYGSHKKTPPWISSERKNKEAPTFWVVSSFQRNPELEDILPDIEVTSNDELIWQNTTNLDFTR